jgi:acyl carrier protein
MENRNKEQIMEYAQERKEVLGSIKKMIVEQLALEIEPEFITDDQPLFGRGLELDSIDALELAIGIYNTYEITLSDGDTAVFSSVNTMADYVMENKGSQDDESTGDDGLEGDIEFCDFDDM